jgi:putative ABC transport system permease protein
MSLFRLSWKNLFAKPLNTSLSLLLLVFGVGTISLLFLLNHQLDQQMKKNVRGIGLVIGANGSPTQMILSSIYQIGSPTGNIPYEKVKRYMKSPALKYAIPVAYGDGYGSYRVLGTTPDYLKLYQADHLAEGRIWERELEVTLGARVARETGLKVGDTFVIGHGLEEHADHPLVVVGILEPNFSVVDQLILTDLNTLPKVHDHHEEEAGHEEHHEEHHQEEPAEITALMLCFKEGKESMAYLMSGQVNRDKTLKGVLPAAEISYINKQMGLGVSTLRAFALIIMFVSGLSVFISLYNSLKDRRYEMALMRSMGASPAYLLWSVLLEGLILAFLGFVLGILCSRLGMWILSRFLTEQYHYDFKASFVLWEAEGILLLITLLIGMLAAILPALQAYNTQIAKTLTDA